MPDAPGRPLSSSMLWSRAAEDLGAVGGAVVEQKSPAALDDVVAPHAAKLKLGGVRVGDAAAKDALPSLGARGEAEEVGLATGRRCGCGGALLRVGARAAMRSGRGAWASGCSCPQSRRRCQRAEATTRTRKGGAGVDPGGGGASALGANVVGVGGCVGEDHLNVTSDGFGIACEEVGACDAAALFVEAHLVAASRAGATLELGIGRDESPAILADVVGPEVERSRLPSQPPKRYAMPLSESKTMAWPPRPEGAMGVEAGADAGAEAADWW
ncbi:hypothetical protein L1887_48923 [Cichorium endivia]|nr:hypothetical protein L1887_48923 [Cichorium endivia]